MPRATHPFPTRNYLQRHLPLYSRNADGRQLPQSDPQAALEANQIYRFVLGLDAAPTPMTDEEMSQDLRDPFAELLLKRGVFPLSLGTLLNEFDKFNAQPDGLVQQDSYLIADGGQIPWSPATAGLNRQLRFAIARSRKNSMDVLISASTAITSTDAFLQVLAWDAPNQVFNYYQRLESTWVWAGNSTHALEAPSRGRGPFDSHVNGSLVMKELKAPWTHWHSSRAKIGEDVLDPTDTLRNEPLFRQKKDANLLEINVVRPGITRWNKARLARELSPDGTFSNVPSFLRQVIETTSVNLTSADVESDQVRDDTSLQLPITFFLNADALLDEIEIEPDINPVSVPGHLYLQSLKHYGFALVTENFRQPGDTYFAFLVPEPAFEDVDVLSLLLEKQLITRHFAASLLMVDFPNPIFSVRRQQLLRYIPQSAQVTAQKSDLPELMVAAIEQVAPGLGEDSPEAEFLANWRLAPNEWKPTFERRIEDYFNHLTERAQTDEGFDAFVRLADSRRREFRKRPLAEFDLTLPTTNIPKNSPFLRMQADGTVTPR